MSSSGVKDVLFDVLGPQGRVEGTQNKEGFQCNEEFNIKGVEFSSRGLLIKILTLLFLSCSLSSVIKPILMVVLELLV